MTERARLAKAAKADGDRAGAKRLTALTKPTLALWAVLAGGVEQPDAAREAVAATTDLADTQAAGDRSALTVATARRRQAVSAAVDAAVAALGRWDEGAAARAGEIRTLVDQLSRQPDLLDTWLDATLREVPQDAWGFAAFAGGGGDGDADGDDDGDGGDAAVDGTMDEPVDEPAHVAAAASRRQREAEARRAEREERAARLAHEAEVREVERELRAAERAVAAAGERVDAASELVERAEEALRAAQAEQDAAEDELAAARERQAAAARRHSNLEPISRKRST